MQTGIDPRIDYVFKKVFASEGNVALTIDLLNSVLGFPRGKVVRELTLMNPFKEKDYEDDKVVLFDVKARDQAGRQHHLEMQRSVTWNFPKRVLYYWATQHGSQMLEGDFYERLCPSFSVCFLDGILFEGGPWHRCFQLLDGVQAEPFCPDLAIHVVELAKFTLTAEQVQTALERWCCFLLHGAELDLENLPATLDTPIIRQALEVLMKLSQEERERIRVLDRLTAQRDAATRDKEALHARDKGREEGREEGELVGRIHLCQKLLKQPQTPREELLRRSVDELNRQAEEWEQRLSAGTNGAG